MKLSADNMRKIRGTKKEPRLRPTVVERPAAVIPAPKVTVEAPPAQKVPDYGEELKQLISVLGNQKERPRKPWRIKFNRDQRGLVDTCELIPVEE